MIEFKNVSFSYGETDEGAIKNINLSIKQGEVVLLCGESGCGKTTLTRLINGLIPHYYEGALSGDVLLGGKSIRKMPIHETAGFVGSVFQNPRSQFFNVDTNSELVFGCENKGVPIAEIESRTIDTVSQFKMEQLLNRSIFNLSGGEKQRVACASVHMCMPEIIVLDEPSSNLDAKATNDLRAIIRKWKAEGKTIVIAEHRLYYVSELATRIIYLENGRVQQDYNNEDFMALNVKTTSGMGLRPLSLQGLPHKIEAHEKNVEKLNFSGFDFTYKNGRSALNTKDFTIPKGGIIGIVGGNGAGKSTFARCLCGLHKKCKGAVSDNAKKLKNKELIRHCYMVMQDVNHQLFCESVLDEALISMQEKTEEKAEFVLQGLNLHELKERHPASLSGGQKQRVAIACAVLSQREIIVFDEPTSGLDFRHMGRVSETIKALNAAGNTIFIISHDLEMILKTCGHILHFENGNVIDNYHLDNYTAEKLQSLFGGSEFSVEEGASTPPPSGNPPPTRCLEVGGLPSAHADKFIN